jgi:sigma-B regulation protein RsbU (phosphoserine phosphatase)
MSYEQATEQLYPGDILIAYSDGVTEPENEFGEFGEERLLEVVRRHRHLSLAAISEQVMQSLRSWIGGQEQPDDITLVLARQR